MTPSIEEMNWEFENEVIRAHKNIEGKIYRESVLKLCWVTPFKYSAEIFISASGWGNYPKPREPPKCVRGNNARHPHRAKNSTYFHHPKLPTNRKPQFMKNLVEIHKGMLTQYCIVMLYNTVLEKIGLTLGMALILPNNS